MFNLTWFVCIPKYNIYFMLNKTNYSKMFDKFDESQNNINIIKIRIVIEMK